MTQVLIGTSGYYYHDWIGPVYPQGTQKQNFLNLYSRNLPFCELNFTYYQMPQQSRLISMIQQTPSNFQFSIKAHKSITHERGSNSPVQAEEFYRSILPMLNEGRLAAVLLQFPYSFHYNTTNRKYLADIIKPLEELPLCIEFRNREWMLEKVYAEFSKRGICFVQTDNPELENLPLPGSTVTADTGYIRFHGRNTENWWKGDNTSRYDYLYTEIELQSWLNRIKEIAPKVKRLLIAFNNHYKGQAVNNAGQIYKMLLEQTDLKPDSVKPFGVDKNYFRL